MKIITENINVYYKQQVNCCIILLKFSYGHNEIKRKIKSNQDRVSTPWPNTDTLKRKVQVVNRVQMSRFHVTATISIVAPCFECLQVVVTEKSCLGIKIHRMRTYLTL